MGALTGALGGRQFLIEGSLVMGCFCGRFLLGIPGGLSWGNESSPVHPSRFLGNCPTAKTHNPNPVSRDLATIIAVISVKAETCPTAFVAINRRCTASVYRALAGRCRWPRAAKEPRT